MQHTYELARTLPPTIHFQSLLIGLGSVYHALQQWDEARSTLEEAEAMAETRELRSLHMSILSQLCMHAAVAGRWEAAHRYALKAVALRKSFERALITWDFYVPYETEALVRGDEGSQARAAVQRMGERLGINRRTRISYLRSMAILAAWEGQREQAIIYLREAAQGATDLGLPGEQWQIQAALGSIYDAVGEQAEAHTAWASAARIIQELAQDIKDEALRSRFLAGPQIQPVLRHIPTETFPMPNDFGIEPGASS